MNYTAQPPKAATHVPKYKHENVCVVSSIRFRLWPAKREAVILTPHRTSPVKPQSITQIWRENQSGSKGATRLCHSRPGRSEVEGPEVDFGPSIGYQNHKDPNALDLIGKRVRIPVSYYADVYISDFGKRPHSREA